MTAKPAAKGRTLHMDHQKRRDDYFLNAPDADMECYSIGDVSRILGVSYETARTIVRSMEHVAISEKRIGVRRTVFRRYMQERTRNYR